MFDRTHTCCDACRKPLEALSPIKHVCSDCYEEFCSDMSDIAYDQAIEALEASLQSVAAREQRNALGYCPF